MAELLLEAHGVSKAFNEVAALTDGRLQLERGSVHALCGGNGAGKSTFLGILMGLLRRDGGEVRLKGKLVDFHSPAEALDHHIAIITQELSPIAGMSVAENLFLGREPRVAGICVNTRAMQRQAQSLLDRLQFQVDARALMRDLSLAQVQLVEIAKAFSHDCDVIIMDEPTSAIGEKETEVLFRAIRSVAAQGTGIIYVSHRLSEIFQIADSYTVFRDGRFVQSGLIHDIDRTELVRAIVGRTLQGRERSRREGGALVLATETLSRSGEFEDISLRVHAGEVVGIYGLMGSGRSEYLNCIYGLTRAQRGSVSLLQRPLPAGKPAASIAAGLSLVTEDRKDSGLVLCASIQDNIALAAYRHMSRLPIIRRQRVDTLVRQMIQRLQIKVSSPQLPVSSMSGGNQQKVVLARCLSTQPCCLLCDEPTRGIDEGAKREVYQLIDRFVQEGGAALVVSSEAQEILDLCDRIAIFRSGRMVQVVDAHRTSQEELLHLAS
ncbi:sugar ABC transporter ATP-binding protein [Herbaspirillum frisingense]|uniref:sugar ABC transporter ATP-binding protein n=1 Tax=Herbaspirillum frisingense TaxID=92645 RepID=UPI001F25EE9A|nr:sugar ABC transporter ATP-binding protein [Herbaspirillum frisingense]UIN22433.1 sugar ABC transporter ATP-binding protein [Herbaspirillum frisingense]